jgi:metal-responsive CopG/Arc/MetJ family transcriptional regulator
VASPNNKFFNVYDSDHSLRRQIEAAAKERDLSRSQLVRHAVRKYLAEDRNIA